MSDKILLDKISEIIVTNNKVLLEAVDEKIVASEKRLTKLIEEKIKESEVRLVGLIISSQKDTIDVLSEMINTGYNMHDKRIRRLEDELGISPAKT